ncbi:MAG: hypothetical protein KZQ93_15780 [Candidatus Thiodiazotropha sp. (ex Monitilora ramsayi)]|nr:hypothetical protein [Candidatus Thiodiazotropha sp. (ex Monitilora ramsayi)]
MFLPFFLDKWSFRTDAISSGTTINLPAEALSALPDLSADGDFGVVLVLDDEAGNTEFVLAHQKGANDVTVERDIYGQGYEPAAWPANTLIECRPPAMMGRDNNNQFETEYVVSPTSSLLLWPKRIGRRVTHVNISQALTINFTTSTVTTPIYTRTVRHTVVIHQDATGGHTITWDSNIKWTGGSAPALSTAANSISILEFWQLSTGEWVGAVRVDGAT